MDKRIFAILILLAAASIATIANVANIQALLEERIVATMTKEGLKLIDTDIFKVIDSWTCVMNPAICIGKMIVGEISENAYLQIAQKNKEAGMIVNTYRQVRSYESIGTDIIEELKFNEKGQISEGILDVEEEIKIGNHIGELKEDDVKVKNTQVKFDKEAGITTIKFKKGSYLEGYGYVEAKGLRYEDIKKGEMELDSEGKVIKADITVSSEAGYRSYTFIVDGEERKVSVLGGTNIRFDGKVIRITGEEFTLNGQYEFKIKKGDVEISKSGENYVFKGEDFIAPGPSGPIHVQDDYFEIPETMKVGGKEITGMAISIAEGLVRVGGKLTITEKGSLLEGGKAEYKKIEVRVQEEPILIADPDADMADYKDNWIKIIERRVDVQSAVKGTTEEIRFLEGNSIVDIDEEGMLAMKITNGDGIEVISRKEEGKIPLMVYRGPEEGASTSGLKVGKFKIILTDKAFVFLPEEQSEYKSVAIQLELPWGNVIETSLSNTFKVTTSDKKERVLFG